MSISSKSTSTIEHVKLLIAGAGPAGLTAALYAARADLKPVVLCGPQPGGQAGLTDRIENYPGFPDGIGGSELGDLFQKQAERFGAIIVYDSVNKVDLSKRPFVIITDAGLYSTDALIIATGASPNKLNVPGERELTGKGVSYCGTCDGFFFKNKRIVVVGGGDSALEEGLFLTRFASEVTIIHRRDGLRAGAILQNRARQNPKIKFIWSSAVTDVIGKERVEAVKVKYLPTGLESIHPTDGLFVFVGNTPNTQMFVGQLEMENGFLTVDNRMHTAIAGIFAAGEAADPLYKQVITSAGMGAVAAIEVTRFLEQSGG